MDSSGSAGQVDESSTSNTGMVLNDQTLADSADWAADTFRAATSDDLSVVDVDGGVRKVLVHRLDAVSRTRRLKTRSLAGYANIPAEKNGRMPWVRSWENFESMHRDTVVGSRLSQGTVHVVLLCRRRRSYGY